MFVSQNQSRLSSEKAGAEQQFTAEQAENARLQDLLDRLTDDKRKLANRVNKLVQNGNVWHERLYERFTKTLSFLNCKC